LLRRRKLARKLRQVVVRNDLATPRYCEGSLHETHRDRLFARPNYQCLKVIRPLLQRSPHFRFVFRTLINTSNARTMATVVVENGFDVVGLHAKLTELGCASATEVVETPMEHSLGLTITFATCSE